MSSTLWTVNAGGEAYEVVYLPRRFKNSELYINGRQVPLDRGAFKLAGLDHPVQLGPKQARLVQPFGGKADLAVDGVYLGSGRPYVPLQGMPAWNWVFVALCVLLLTMGGAFPVLLGMLGVIYCIRCAVRPDWRTGKKVLYSALVTAGVWMGALLAAVLLSALLY